MRKTHRIIALVLLLLVWGLTACAVASEAPPTKEVRKKISEDTGRNGIRILAKYPAFENIGKPLVEQSLNTTIEQVAQDRIDLFKINVNAAATKAIEPMGLCNLAVGYTIVSMTPEVVSLRFDIHEFIAGTEQPYNYFLTFNYDLAANQMLGLSDVFSGEYLPQLAEKLHEHIDAKFENRFTDHAPTYHKLVGPKAKSFELMVINMKQRLITFTLDPHQTGRNRLDPIEIDVPFDELQPLLRLQALKSGI